MRRFLPQAAIAIRNMHRTTSLESGMLAAEKKHVMANLARGVSHDVNNAFGSVLPLVQQMIVDVKRGRVDPEVLVRQWGGQIGKLVTDVPGSSAYYLGGFVTYCDALKAAALSVPPSLIAAHGAVSEAVAVAMAEACRDIAGSDYALSVTGIAGPGGGTQSKPVGLVYISVAGRSGTSTKQFRFPSWLGRTGVRERAAMAAIDLLRRRLTVDVRTG